MGDDNQITALQQALFDRIQNITLVAGGKSDDCDAEEYELRPQTGGDSENEAGMLVAPFPNDSQIQIEEGDFGHAVDNPGDFAGALVSRFAYARWWRPDSLAARSRRGRVGD